MTELTVKTKTYNVIDIARYIVNYYNEHNSRITILKLHNLLYLIQAAFVTEYNKPCFDAKIEAWSYGPVVPVVQEKFKKIQILIITINDCMDRIQRKNLEI